MDNRHAETSWNECIQNHHGNDVFGSLRPSCGGIRMTWDSLLWSLGMREVGGSLIRIMFHPARKLVRFSLLMCPSITNSSPRVSYHMRLPLMTHPATLITRPIQVSYYYVGDISRKAMKPIRGIEVAGGNQLSRTRALKWICAENNVLMVSILFNSVCNEHTRFHKLKTDNRRQHAMRYYTA